MRRLVIFSTLLIMIWGCASSPKKDSAENFMVKRGTNLLAQGGRYLDYGCFTEASKNFTLAYQDFQASDHLPGMAQALNNLAFSFLGLEEAEKAESFASRALAINRSLGDSLGEAANLSILGKVHLMRGEDEDARRLWQEALDRARKGSVELRSNILIGLSVALMHAEKTKEARTHLDQALALNPYSAAVRQNLGKIAERSGDLSVAEKYYLNALELDRKKGYAPGIAADLTVLGGLYLKMDKKPEAAETLSRAVNLRILLNQKEKADAVRKVLRQAGLDMKASAHEAGEGNIPPPCR
jgi:tetratricopeptide (TPR) repeat protein